ncbi:DNA repair protein XRCC3 isoform X2 [Odocoileus virginianus]|uniref:DNA repair protein XRCC3 isoform X2 n=1 Tax=Odocoileus virginianus TaxID=9874 RepID=A0ABM4J1A7_ODOVR
MQKAKSTLCRPVSVGSPGPQAFLLLAAGPGLSRVATAWHGHPARHTAPGRWPGRAAGQIPTETHSGAYARECSVGPTRATPEPAPQRGSVTPLHSSPGPLEGAAGTSEPVSQGSRPSLVVPAEEMDLDRLDLHPRIIAAVKKAKLRSVKEVLHLSGPDLQRLTRLSSPDVRLLLRAAASLLQGHGVCTALHLLRQEGLFPEQHQRLSLGCPVLDALLRGGLPLDGVTELAGRSSAGKTQLALQLCLAVQLPQRHGGLGAGAVYVCTEDAFPSRRLQQLIAQQQRLRADVPADVISKIKFGHQIFIEHAADVASPVYRPQRHPPSAERGRCPVGVQRASRLPLEEGRAPLSQPRGPSWTDRSDCWPLAGCQDNATCGSHARGGGGGRWGRLWLNKGAGGSEGSRAAESRAARPDLGPSPLTGYYRKNLK